MITFGTPAFLLAGALAALVPLALHLIRRRPPSRAPLPTARFLSDDPRTSIRVSRPTDLLLLALRMLLLVLVGAAFARPAWLPAPDGTSEIVLLDRSAPMAGAAWRPAVDAARRALIAPDGSARGELVLFGREPVPVPRA
ncbi:MAG TPA: BatA domain-containing protein, partial [Longimicrobium sp.]|nr:BatA domain-containing protein [Longimicrobium sp.]